MTDCTNKCKCMCLLDKIIAHFTTHTNVSLSVWNPTYSESSKSSGALGACPLAHLPLDPAHEVPEWFGARDDVEGGRQCGPFFKVTHPQLCPGKLPLNVCMILKPRLGRMIRSTNTNTRLHCIIYCTHSCLFIFLYAVWQICAHSNVLVGVVHHGYEHVEEHHQWDDVVGAEHGGTDKLSELMVCIHVGHIQADQTKDWPEERLQGLK